MFFWTMKDLWWRQRAKEDWLKMGDRNTRFFHACASEKRRQNRVETIIDERGQRRESQAEIENAFVVYFSKLFTRGTLGDIASCHTTHRESGFCQHECQPVPGFFQGRN
jgi:hypothetical protein